MEHAGETTLTRDDVDIPVTIDIEWSYDRGEFVESGHWCNGYNRGWYCDKLTATDGAGNPVVLTEDEIETLKEKYHPDNLPDPNDRD